MSSADVFYTPAGTPTGTPGMGSKHNNNWLWWIVIVVVVIAVLVLLVWMLRDKGTTPTGLRVGLAGSPPVYTATWTAPVNTGSAKLPLQYQYWVLLSGNTIQSGTTPNTSFVIDVTKLTGGVTYTVAVAACGNDGNNCSTQATTTFTFSMPLPNVTNITFTPGSDVYLFTAGYTFDSAVTGVVSSASFSTTGSPSYSGVCSIPAGGLSATCQYNTQTIYMKSNPSLQMYAADLVTPGAATMSSSQAAIGQHWSWDPSQLTINLYDPGTAGFVLALGPNNTVVPVIADTSRVRFTTTTPLAFRYDATAGTFAAYTGGQAPIGYLSTQSATTGGVLSIVNATPTSPQFQFGINNFPATTPASITFTGAGVNAGGTGTPLSKTFPLPTNSGPVTGLSVTHT